MKTQPFDPFEPFSAETRPETDPPSFEPPAANAFFDRAGLLWMMACVAIAMAAGHWIPRLTEPDTKPGAAGRAAAPAMARQADKNKVDEAPNKLSRDDPRLTKPLSQLKREVF